MKSLYRRYRPTSLKDVVGQPQVTDVLAKSLENGKISHAYLFIGPRGCGKTSVARIFAHEINKFSYEIEDDYVDIIEIDGASNRGIDNIRELREKVMIAPTAGKYKVYIIDEVHMLTKEAFNALLKTLEEPPEHAIFIMATTDAHKVPVTITSRAQTYVFKLADEKVMFDFLKSVTKKEKIEISDDALKIIVRRGGGSFRDSLSLLDQISTLSETEITKEKVIMALGLPEDEKITEILESYVAGDIVKITSLLKDLFATGIKSETLAEEMIAQILENPKVELFELLRKLPEVKAPFAEAKLLVATLSSVSKPVSSSAGLEFSSTSYAGRPGKSATNGSFLGAGRNIRVENPNQDTLQKKQVLETKTSPADFNWDGFVEKVREVNEAVYSQLKKVSHNFNSGTLEIFPEKKISKTILSRENNKRILVEAAGGAKILIREVGEKDINAAEDATISQISDIMGGKVEEDGGGNPF